MATGLGAVISSHIEVPVKQFCFVCSGNLYRSRYAEAWFNYLSITHERHDLRAFSRGIAVQPTDDYRQGEIFTRRIPLAKPTYDRMLAKNIPFCLIGPTNQALSDGDCGAAEVIFLMNRVEHLPVIERQYPAYLDRVESYDIGGQEYAPSTGYCGPEWDGEDALTAIERLVTATFKKFAAV